MSRVNRVNRWVGGWVGYLPVRRAGGERRQSSMSAYGVGSARGGARRA